VISTDGIVRILDRNSDRNQSQWGRGRFNKRAKIESGTQRMGGGGGKNQGTTSADPIASWGERGGKTKNTKPRDRDSNQGGVGERGFL